MIPRVVSTGRARAAGEFRCPGPRDGRILFTPLGPTPLVRCVACGALWLCSGDPPRPISRAAAAGAFPGTDLGAPGPPELGLTELAQRWGGMTPFARAAGDLFHVGDMELFLSVAADGDSTVVRWRDRGSPRRLLGRFSAAEDAYGYVVLRFGFEWRTQNRMQPIEVDQLAPGVRLTGAGQLEWAGGSAEVPGRWASPGPAEVSWTLGVPRPDIAAACAHADGWPLFTVP